jgi:hypothetical protein
MLPLHNTAFYKHIEGGVVIPQKILTYLTHFMCVYYILKYYIFMGMGLEMVIGCEGEIPERLECCF